MSATNCICFNICQCFFINILLFNRSVATSILAWANGSKLWALVLHSKHWPVGMYRVLLSMNAKNIHIFLAILVRAIYLRMRPKSSVGNASASALKWLIFYNCVLFCGWPVESIGYHVVEIRREKRAHVHTVAAFSSFPSNVAASLIIKVFL